MLAPLIALAMFAPMHQDTLASRRGSDLVKECKAFVKVMDSSDTPGIVDMSGANYCMGYLDGIIAYMDKDTSHVCLTAYTSSTLARVYVAFMEAHPKLFDEDQKLGAYLALLDAYPCPKK